MTSLSRRAALKRAALLSGLGVAARVSDMSFAGVGVLAQGPAAGAARPPAPKGATLVLLGTQGGPSINLTRSEPASAVIVDGQPYLVDCGYGTLRAFVPAGIRNVDVGHVFVTHLHNDHTADIAAMLSYQWTGSKQQPTTVFGPPGTAAMVEGAIAFFKGDVEVRTVDEGRTLKPEAAFKGRDVSGTAIVEAYRDEKVTARAIENTHFPDRAKAKMTHRSLAWRLDTAERSFVFSGDTAYSKGLVELARGAEVFVCEAVDVTMMAGLQRTAQAAGPGESVARHIAETHSSTEDVGRMAAEAKVKTVVLNHLLPGSNQGPAGELPDTAYINAVRKYFDGEVIVGRDLMRI